jgi:hypothetical protein
MYINLFICSFFQGFVNHRQSSKIVKHEKFNANSKLEAPRSLYSSPGYIGINQLKVKVHRKPQNIGLGVMLFNATFNNISDISWQSVLLGLTAATWAMRSLTHRIIMVVIV